MALKELRNQGEDWGYIQFYFFVGFGLILLLIVLLFSADQFRGLAKGFGFSFIVRLLKNFRNC